MTGKYIAEWFDEALSALLDARKYVQHAHDEAEASHDNYGDLYMDEGQYEIMQEISSILSKIDALLGKKES